MDPIIYYVPPEASARPYKHPSYWRKAVDPLSKNPAAIFVCESGHEQTIGGNVSAHRINEDGSVLGTVVCSKCSPIFARNVKLVAWPTGVHGEQPVAAKKG